MSPTVADAPFSRRVTSTLVASLHALKEALVEIDRGGDIDAFRRRVPEGVSANLCEAASSLADTADGVDVSLSWALTRAVDQRHASISHAAFSKHNAATLREVAKEFRAREPRPGERLRGVVIRLNQDADAPPQRATLKTEVDGMPVSVGMETSPADRTTFIDAYNRRSDIVVEGKLVRVGQRWTLREPGNVTVLPAEVEDEDVGSGDLLGRVG